MSEKPIKHGDLIEDGIYNNPIEQSEKLLERTNQLIAGFKELAKITGKKLPFTDPKTLKDYEEQSKAIKETKAAFEGLTQAQKVQITQQEKLNKAKREFRDQLKSEQSAYAALNTVYKVAAQRAKDLAATYGINSKEAREAARYAKHFGDQLKAIDATVGQHQRNVGNYKESIKEAADELGFFGKVILKAVDYLDEQIKSLKDANVALKAQKVATTEAAAATEGAQLATTRWSKAFNVLKFSIKALGITALVGLLGSIAASFKTTEKGIVQFEAILNSLGSVFKVFIGKLGQFGKGLIDFFPALFKDLSNGIFNLTQDFKEFLGLTAEPRRSTDNTVKAMNQMKHAFDGLGDAIRKTIDLEFELAQLRRDNRRGNLADIAIIRELGSEVEKLNQIASDQTLPFEERNKAAEESLKLQEKLADAEIRIARRSVAEAQKELAVRKLQNEDTLEAQEHLSEALDKLDDAQSKAQLLRLKTEEIARQTRVKELTNQIQLLELQFDKEKELREKEITDVENGFKRRLELIDQQDKASQDLYDKETKRIRDAALLNIESNSLLSQADKERLTLAVRTLDFNDLLAESDEALLEQRIKSLNLGDKEEDLLRRILVQRRAEISSINLKTRALEKEQEADRKRVADLGQQLFDEQTRGQLDQLNAALEEEQSLLKQNYEKQQELFAKSQQLKNDQLRSDAEFKKKQINADKTKSEASKAAEINVNDFIKRPKKELYEPIPA